MIREKDLYWIMRLEPKKITMKTLIRFRCAEVISRIRIVLVYPIIEQKNMTFPKIVLFCKMQWMHLLKSQTTLRRPTGNKSNMAVMKKGVWIYDENGQGKVNMA